MDDTPAAAIPGSPADELGDLVVARAEPGRLVIATSAAELLGAYRGLLGTARTSRSGLLLGSGSPGDAEVFGLRPERRPPGPAGRALLVQGGRAVSVQLALPPDDARPFDPPGPSVNGLAPLTRRTGEFACGEKRSPLNGLRGGRLARPP